MSDTGLVVPAGAPAPAAALVAALAAAVAGDGVDAAVAVRPVTDALKRIEGDRIVGDVDRGGVLLPAGPLLVRSAPASVDAAALAGDPGVALAVLLAAGARVVPVGVDVAGGPA